MNAFHLRDEINPFASVSYATYAELEVEELAPVVARPRKTLQPPGPLKKVRDRPNRIAHRMRACRFTIREFGAFCAGVAPASVRLRTRR
ncbi:MAG: hypothetical protein JO119_08290 [Acidobacteria bacterium]|nr:hypothetical protein [Acidobacteriota bacterium]